MCYFLQAIILLALLLVACTPAEPTAQVVPQRNINATGKPRFISSFASW